MMDDMASNPANRQSKVTEESIAEAARLKAIWLSRSHPNQAEFGEQYSIGNQSAVGQFLNGKVPLSLKAARGFAEGLRCDIADFSVRLASEAAKNLKFIAGDEDFVSVRRVDVQFSNGEGRVVDHIDDRPPLSFRADFLRKLGVPLGQAVIVDADGDSNFPTIRPGSVVLLNQADRENLNGDFFGFYDGNRLLIKRLSRVEGVGVLAVADNPDFRPKTKVYAEGDDSFGVIGRC